MINGCWEEEKGVKGKNKIFALSKQVISFILIWDTKRGTVLGGWEYGMLMNLGLWDTHVFGIMGCYFESGVIVGHSSGTIQ